MRFAPCNPVLAHSPIAGTRSPCTARKDPTFQESGSLRSHYRMTRPLLS